MFRSIVVIAMLAAGDAALISKPTMKPKTELPRARAKESNVLALRGGGMIDQGMWMKAFSVFMGLYGVGFVLAPGMVIDQNFDTTYDKYHIFISRMAGAFMWSWWCWTLGLCVRCGSLGLHALAQQNRVAAIIYATTPPRPM